MGIKKKKYVIVISVCVIICFTFYQLYFYLSISSESATSNRIVHVINYSNDIVMLRSHADKNIDDNGVIRGVLYSVMPRYRPDTNDEFKCLNSGENIPFEYVNDDYCDCADATDEPSTSACVNGTFYCSKQYKNKPVSLNFISSGKVNDGICDCCDGSDEWLHAADKQLLTIAKHYASKCSNVCDS